MPGLSDLLRNPRRLRQFASTPGNYESALSYASQGSPARVGRRPASRASQAKEDEPNTLETGEVIEQVQLPDGSLVKPATPSGRLVKAPGKSNLYLDPTTGEPYNADPSQPTGLRSAWNNARQVTKDGKVFKTISGVGEREIGVDPKVAEDATKAAAKREAENRRLALAREKRPYNIDRVTGEPVPLQTDEEWAATKQAKAAKLDEAARVKRLKDQADVIDLEADRISLTAPKPAKEDEEAFNAAESALSQFAAGQDMEETAAKYAAAPATDEAGQQAKAAAENYLAYKDKVKPAKEAEKKVQELKLRALDIKEQIINPQKWKAGKTASLAALPDDDLVAEVKAQADIINEQEEQAVGTLDTITKGRNAIVAELNSFNEEFQSQAEQGLTAEEMAALDIQKARLEQSLADYDEHNGEAKAESDAALKAAADRRDVLAVAGTELEGRAAKQAEAAGQAKAKAETLAKAKPLYEGWAKGLYSDDWRTEEETPRLAQEAAKAGLDVASAKDALQTYRQLDWSNPRRDAKTGQTIAEEVRTLPDGNVTVNPTMWGDADAYKKAVDASQGTPEGKAKALEAFPKLQEIHAEKAVEILSKSANIPGADNFMAWRERKIEEDQATQGKLGFARQSPAKQAIAYMEEMKNRSWFRKAGEQVGLGLLAGFQDIATQALGVGAMVTGSETLADLAAANTENTQSVVGAQNLEGSDTDYALRVMGMGARMTPAVAAMIAGAGAVGGGLGTAAVLAGGQTAGSMFADLYRTAKEDSGLSHGEAWKKAALPAALAGTITGLLTKGMGATGLERVFSDTATQETARNTFKAMLGQFVKGAAEELPEEIADEYFTTILQESAASADPVATFKNFANTLPELAGVTALMGGAGALMQARRQTGAEGPGMAPNPEEGPAPMPVQPRPAGPAPTPAPETPQDVTEQIAKFNPTGATPLPQSVAATAKRTGRPPAAVARQAAAGVVKIAQGQSLESLDIEEQEALGFVNKGGKITLDTKVTPLVYLYKDKPVLRNAAAEWLTDEAQEGLAGMVNLTEAERKAQIDAEEAAAKAKTVKASRLKDIDREYAEAVKAGDLTKAQELVDEAAREAGLRELYHGSSDAYEGEKTFEDRDTSSGADAMGIYMSPDRETSEGYGQTDRYWVEADLPGFDEFNQGLSLEDIAAGKTTPTSGDGENSVWRNHNGTIEIVVNKAAQIRSSKAVVKDSSGRVIPPSERFAKAKPAAKKKAGQAKPAKAESTPQAGPEVKTSDSLSENESSNLSPASNEQDDIRIASETMLEIQARTAPGPERDAALAERRKAAERIVSTLQIGDIITDVDGNEYIVDGKPMNGKVFVKGAGEPVDAVTMLIPGFATDAQGNKIEEPPATITRKNQPTPTKSISGQPGALTDDVINTRVTKDLEAEIPRLKKIINDAMTGKEPDTELAGMAQNALDRVRAEIARRKAAINTIPAPANEPQPQTAVSPEPSSGPVVPESRELPVVPEQPPAPAQEASPEPAPAAEPALTPKQADQMARAKADYESSMRYVEADPDPQIRESRKKAAGMKFSAAKRLITGKLTAKEAENKAKREASNFEGKAVSVDGKNAEVIGNAFGKVKVKFADGTKAAVPADNVKPPVEAGPEAKELRRVTNQSIQLGELAQQSRDAKDARQTEAEQRFQSLSNADLLGMDKNELNDLHADLTRGLGHPYPDKQVLLRQLDKLRQPTTKKEPAPDQGTDSNASTGGQASQKEASQPASAAKPPEQMTPEEWRNNHFDENEDRGLPADYFADHQFNETRKNKTQVLSVNGIDFLTDQYGGVHAFDGEKNVGYGDGKAFVVEPTYQRRGIGTEIIAITKKEQPTKKIGSQTAAGQALVASFHKRILADAIKANSPVNAAAVDAYGITLPEGYTREGDLYVYRPAPSPAPASQPAGQAEAFKVGDFVRANGKGPVFKIESIGSDGWLYLANGQGSYSAEDAAKILVKSTEDAATKEAVKGGFPGFDSPPAQPPRPATPEGRAEAALAEYEAEVRKTLVGKPSKAAKDLAARKLDLAKRLRARLTAMAGAVDFDVYAKDLRAKSGELEVKPVGRKGSILFINPEKLIDRLTAKHATTEAGREAMDVFILHEFIHKAAIGNMDGAKIIGLYNLLTTEAKAASKALYLADSGLTDFWQDDKEFAAAHEWFAQLVEARLRGKISNQAEIEASQDPAFRDRLLALLRDFVAQLRDIAKLVTDKAQAARIEAEADAVQAIVADMAAKAGLEIQTKANTSVAAQFKAVIPMAEAMMEQPKGANADATKQAFEEWAAEFGVTDLAENPTLTEKLRATYNQKRAKAGLEIQAPEAAPPTAKAAQLTKTEQREVDRIAGNLKSTGRNLSVLNELKTRLSIQKGTEEQAIETAKHYENPNNAVYNLDTAKRQRKAAEAHKAEAARLSALIAKIEGTPAQPAPQAEPAQASQAPVAGKPMGQAEAEVKGLLAESEPKPRNDIDNGTHRMQFRLRHYSTQEAADMPFLEYDRFGVERRSVRTNEDDGSVVYGEWNLFAKGATKRQAIEDGIGDSGFRQATSTDSTHREIVADAQAKTDWDADHTRRVNEATNEARQATNEVLRIKTEGNKKYEQALKRAKIDLANADPEKLKALQGKLLATYKPQMDAAKATMDAANAKLKAVEAEVFQKSIAPTEAARPAPPVTAEASPATPSLAEQIRQAAGAGFTETSQPKAKPAFRVRTLKGGERVIEQFEGKAKGWKRQIALRGEEMDDAWIQKWVESRNGFLMPTDEPAEPPAQPGQEAAQPAANPRIAEIDAELAKLQARYEQKAKQQSKGSMVPPAIKADALRGITKMMDKLDAEKKALLAAKQPSQPAQAPAPEGQGGQVQPEDKPPVGGRDEPAPPAITAPGVRYNDIPLELARRAHMWTSFVPDVRARGEQRQYVDYMNGVWAALEKEADTDEKMAQAKEQFEIYRARYVEKNKDLLRSHAGLLSAMITGPAKFPVAKAEKRNNAYNNKLKDFIAWDKKAKNAMLGKVNPQASGIISADDANAPEQIQARIDELKARQEMMKKGNTLIKKNAGDKTAMAQALRGIGVPESEIKSVLFPPQGYGLGWQHFTLTNNNANIRRNEERLERMQSLRARPTLQATFDGGRVEENTEANRVQIFFDTKPPAEMIAKLKANGFKWAPSQSAWQRQRTPNAVRAAEAVLGVKMAPPAVEAAPAADEEADFGPATPTPLAADEGQPASLALPPAGQAVTPGDQKRAQAGGEVGPNGEWYPGGAFIATTEMPKKLRQKLQKMVGDGLVEVARGEREKQQPGMFSPYKNLVGIAMGPTGNLNEAYLSNDRNNFAPGYVAQVRDAVKAWNDGNRQLPMSEFPLLVNATDIARTLDAGQAISGEIINKNAWAKSFVETYAPNNQATLRNPPAPEGGQAASQEASQPEADEEADPDLAAFMAEQQRLAEEESAAREALRNDPDAIDAMQASGKMSGRNLSKQFEYPEARAVYQALTAARDELGGPETVQLDKLREWAKETFDSDSEKYVQWAADMAEESKLLDVDEQAVLGQAFQFLTREARLTGDKNIRALLNKVGNYYLDTGTRLAQAMSARRDPLESPQERWTKALDIVFGPSEAVRRKLRILPTAAGKARRIASLEAELAEARGSRRADIEAALKTARAQETQEELLEKDDAESQKIKERVLKNIGVTEDDLMLSGTDRVALQSAILDLPAVKEGLDAYKGKDNDGYNIMRLAFRGFSDEHIANALNLNQDDVGKFIHDATAAIIRPAVAAQVKAGTGFGGLIKAGFAKLKKAVGLGLPPKAIEAQPALLGGKRQTVADVTAEVNRVMAYALQSAKARNSGKLMSKVVMTPGGQRVRVFVPFDPDDMANYYAFAREYTAAKASAFDKVYEYWINWPLLSGPQTQVANITGNAAQVAWHYTGQRLAEATLNLAYQDPNAPQFREFKHILKGFWQGIGPAFEMARQTFLTEGDTIRHKYLGEPMQIDMVDGDLDKVGNIRASVGGQAGRVSRLPGRVLRFTDAFFKTAIMYAEASAVAYRRAHVEAKAQGLRGQARADFIDTEIANTINDTSSAVWGEVMKTAEELLFQDDNSATEIVDTVLGGYKGIKDLEKLLAEAEAKGDSDLAAKLQKRIRSRKFVGSLMRWIFPFQRTPTNIVRAGIKKAGGSAISLLYGLTRAGWLAMGKNGVPMIKSYPKAMQIKDASETLLAGLGWLALASMLEGDDNDDEKPVLLVGTRSHSLKERAATDQFLRKYGGENSIVWQDGKGKVLGSLPFGRYEPAATTLTTWIDAYRNYQEVKRLKSQGENASYTTYMLSSLVSSLEDKSFLQGFANAMQFVRDVEEKRENPDQNAGVKMLMNNVIPNLIKQPLRNMDDVLRERTTAGPGYAALPNPTIAPKLPIFAAQPKISTTGERLPKAFTPPARLLFQANTKVTPQPDALLYRANRLHPTKRWSPQPLQRDDYTANPPGKAKPVPITDPAKKRQFAELAGRLYAANAAKVAAKAMPSEKAQPGESLIKAFKKAREDAMAAARAQAHAMGLHKATATP